MADPVLAFALDEALALRMVTSLPREAPVSLPEGARLATEAEYGDPLPDGPVVIAHPELVA